MVLEEDQTLKADYEVLQQYSDYSILYSGRQDASIKNPWYTILVKQSNQKGFLASADTAISDTTAKQGEAPIIGKIKLKVKDGVKSTTAKVSLEDMTVYGKATTSSTTESPIGYEISDATLDLNVKGATQNENELIINQKANNVENITQNSVKNNDEDKANNNVPYTGIEDMIPVIFILAIIAVLAYINYRKYKNI